MGKGEEAEQEAEMKRQQQEFLDRLKIAVLCVEIGAGDYLDQLVRELVPTYLMTIDEQATKPNKTRKSDVPAASLRSTF